MMRGWHACFCTRCLLQRCSHALRPRQHCGVSPCRQRRQERSVEAGAVDIHKCPWQPCKHLFDKHALFCFGGVWESKPQRLRSNSVHAFYTQPLFSATPYKQLMPFDSTSLLNWPYRFMHSACAAHQFAHPLFDYFVQSVYAARLSCFHSSGSRT